MLSKWNLLLILMIFSSISAPVETAFAEPAPRVEYLCSGVDSFDTAPDRPLKFGHETNLLLLITKPYITSSGKDGILSKWQFRGMNNEFIGEISKSATWSDGEPVTALEAAAGILSGLKYRAIGKLLRIRGHQELPGTEQILKHPDEYLKIIDEKTFSISFDGKMENLQGAVREALSENSRINRVWPIRFKNGKKFKDIVSKNRIDWTNTSPEIYPTTKLKVIVTNNKSHCNDADYYLSSSLLPEAMNSSNIEQKLSQNQQALFAILNPLALQTDTLEKRKTLISELKRDLIEISDEEFTIMNRFFTKGEIGFSSPNENQNQFITSSERHQAEGTIRIQPWTRIPNSWKVKKHLLKKNNRYEFTSEKDSTAPIFLVVAPVNNQGMQISLQNGTTFSKLESYKSNYPRTFSALLEIQKTSSATLPKSVEVFNALEAAAFSEFSIIPILRLRISVISKRKSSSILIWSPNGELELRERI